MKTNMLILAASLLVGNSLTADPTDGKPGAGRSRQARHTLVVDGVVPATPGFPPALALTFGGIPGRIYVLQGSADFRSWDTLDVFRVRNARTPETLLVPIELPYRFFRVVVAKRNSTWR